jgi:hypothetical protein
MGSARRDSGSLSQILHLTDGLSAPRISKPALKPREDGHLRSSVAPIIVHLLPLAGRVQSYLNKTGYSSRAATGRGI